MLCIPWCILNPFITVVVTPFIPPFHNNHPFHELIAGSEISSVLLVIRGRLGSLANEHPAGPSPPKILKTSTRGCWSIGEVHPVKNHFFRRYVVLFFGGGGCPNIPNKNLLPQISVFLPTWNKIQVAAYNMADSLEVHGSLKQNMWYMFFFTGGSCLDIGNVNKPSEVKAWVLAGKKRTALEVNTSSGHFSLVLCCSKI